MERRTSIQNFARGTFDGFFANLPPIWQEALLEVVEGTDPTVIWKGALINSQGVPVVGVLFVTAENGELLAKFLASANWAALRKTL